MSERGTPSGSTAHPEAQLATVAATGTRSIGGPGTRALAVAIAAARRPASRASDSSGTAWKPQLDPTSARTPSPMLSSWVSSSMSPLRADIDS